MLVGAEQLFTFQDARISESSSLVSTPAGDWLWTANDSGDSARVFAVGPTGSTLEVATLPGTTVTDVEDAALGPDRTLYLADIGDNNSRRESVTILRVPEPAVDPAGRNVRRTTAPPQRAVLTYADGAHDAETLLVHPRTGQVVVVTKGVFGTDVYAAPRPLGDGVLQRVGSLPIRSTGTPGGPGIGGVAQVLATGGAVSPDGRRVVVRTYTDAYVWDVPGDDLVEALQAKPTVVALPETRQGEAVTWTQDSAALLVSSEGRSAPVQRVSLPAQTAPPPPTEAASPTGTAPVRPGAAARSDRSVLPPPLLLLGGVAGGAVLAYAGLLRRRSRR